jgi:hypothetical protein
LLIAAGGHMTIRLLYLSPPLFSWGGGILVFYEDFFIIGLLKQQMLIAVYRLPTKENKLLVSVIYIKNSGLYIDI